MTNIQHEPRIDFAVGFKLLTKFQSQWEQIHAVSEKNVEKAQEALSKLEKLEQKCDRQLQAVEIFISSYKSISKLDEHINDIGTDLKLLEGAFSKIEDLLTVLKNHKENVETNEYVDKMKADFNFRTKEIHRHQNVRKEEIKIDHARRVEDIEREQLAEIELRRHLYEKAFEEEKSRFLERKRKSQE